MGVSHAIRINASFEDLVDGLGLSKARLIRDLNGSKTYVMRIGQTVAEIRIYTADGQLYLRYGILSGGLYSIFPLTVQVIESKQPDQNPMRAFCRLNHIPFRAIVYANRDCPVYLGKSQWDGNNCYASVGRYDPPVVMINVALEGFPNPVERILVVRDEEPSCWEEFAAFASKWWQVKSGRYKLVLEDKGSKK